MFKFVITNLFSGSVQGTNDEEKASELSYSQDFFVVNTITCKWLTDAIEKDIEEIE